REGVAFDFAERFVIGQKESLVFPKRTAEAATELVLPELRLYTSQRIAGLRHIENVLRVEFVVAEKLKQRSMKGVCSRFRHHVDHSAARSADFRGVHVAVHFYFLEGVNRRLHDD